LGLPSTVYFVGTINIGTAVVPVPAVMQATYEGSSQAILQSNNPSISNITVISGQQVMSDYAQWRDNLNVGDTVTFTLIVEGATSTPSITFTWFGLHA
jgi:hypothetical protein